MIKPSSQQFMFDYNSQNEIKCLQIVQDMTVSGALTVEW
jgi:hypothetical protein